MIYLSFHLSLVTGSRCGGGGGNKKKNLNVRSPLGRIDEGERGRGGGSRVEIQSPLVDSVPRCMTGCTEKRGGGGGVRGVRPAVFAVQNRFF